jgi:hypothetical protein
MLSKISHYYPGNDLVKEIPIVPGRKGLLAIYSIISSLKQVELAKMKVASVKSLSKKESLNN